MSMLLRSAGHLLIICTCVLATISASGARADDEIERAFASQKKPPASRTEVKTEVRERAAGQAGQVRDRALELEAQAQRERERSRQRDAQRQAATSPQAETARPRGAPPAGAAARWICRLRCTDAGILNEKKGDWMTFEVSASNKLDAQSRGRELARQHCAVVRSEWGGTQCDKQ